jgi:hypothetical protein
MRMITRRRRCDLAYLQSADNDFGEDNDDTMRASTESVHLHAHAGTGRQQAERLYFLGGLIMTLAVRVGSPERIVFVRATHPYV